VTLLVPRGCGKTTRCSDRRPRATRGEIAPGRPELVYSGARRSIFPSDKAPIGIVVFQSYPSGRHMNVFDNVAFR